MVRPGPRHCASMHRYHQAQGIGKKYRNGIGSVSDASSVESAKRVARRLARAVTPSPARPAATFISRLPALFACSIPVMAIPPVSHGLDTGSSAGSATCCCAAALCRPWLSTLAAAAPRGPRPAACQRHHRRHASALPRPAPCQRPASSVAGGCGAVQPHSVAPAAAVSCCMLQRCGVWHETWH